MIATPGMLPPRAKYDTPILRSHQELRLGNAACGQRLSRGRAPDTYVPTPLHVVSLRYGSCGVVVVKASHLPLESTSAA